MEGLKKIERALAVLCTVLNEEKLPVEIEVENMTRYGMDSKAFETFVGKVTYTRKFGAVNEDDDA